MDINEAENDESSNPTRNNVEAAVISHVDGNNDSTKVDTTDLISQEDEAVKDVEEMSPPEMQQTMDVKQGEEEANVTTSDGESAQESNDDANSTAIFTLKVEEAIDEHNENDVGANSNDVDLLGFTDTGATEVTSDEAEISSYQEKDNTEKTLSNSNDDESETVQDDKNGVDTTASVPIREEAVETGEETMSNVVDLLGFTEGEGEITTSQAEIAQSFPENDNIAGAVSNDFNLLSGFVDDKLKEEAPNGNDIDNSIDEKIDGEKPDLGGEGVEKKMTEVVDDAHNEAAIETNEIPIQDDEVENNLFNLATEEDKPNEHEMIEAESEEIDQTQEETVEKTNPNVVPNESCESENLLSLSLKEPRNISEATDGSDDQVDSLHLNTGDIINSNVDSLEAQEDNPNAVEPLPSVDEDDCINDTINGDSIQTNSETEIPSSPTDGPSATIVALPEEAFSVSEGNLKQSVETCDEEIAPATTNETIDAENTRMQENTKPAEEDVDNVQFIEVENAADTIPAQKEEAENITEEEAEWLSMGLTLGDALRQIVALTDERDSAIAICQEKDAMTTQAESLLIEVQSRLEAEMNRRAESDSKARNLIETMKTYEARLEAYEKMEDELEAVQTNLLSTVAEKSKLEMEITKLREVRDESERKEAVLSNRLNEAKKKEANKSNTAGRLELDNEELRANLESTKAELENVSKSKSKLESTMEKLKTKAVERVKQAETALKEERELNEERKKKMKLFVETKAEELREAKESASDMQKELQETRASLTASRDREESIQNELESARIKYREVLRDMERMKRNAEALHNMGSNLEQELEKSANETEEHKKKRISAKHELMTMMRTLEVEKGMSEKLRESMKFTFAPKAQSQQQLLSECLRDLEQELDRLAIKLGKPLLPHHQEDNSEPSKNDGGLERSPSNGSAKKARRGRASKADVDTERLISNLEQETQHVSKGIMALVSSIERMRVLLDEDNPFNCMAFLSNQFGLAIGTREARHQRLGDDTPADDGEETMSITSFEQK